MKRSQIPRHPNQRSDLGKVRFIRRQPSDASQQWFAASFLLEAQLLEEPDAGGTLFERRVVLISATDESEAERKALAYCGQNPESYRNEYGGRVIWQCQRVLTITPIYDAELKDGVEVYSELLEGDPDLASLANPGR